MAPFWCLLTYGVRSLGWGYLPKAGMGKETREAIPPSSAIIVTGSAEVGSLCRGVSCHSSGPCPAQKYTRMGGGEISGISRTWVLISSPISPWGSCLGSAPRAAFC